MVAAAIDNEAPIDVELTRDRNRLLGSLRLVTLSMADTDSRQEGTTMRCDLPDGYTVEVRHNPTRDVLGIAVAMLVLAAVIMGLIGYFGHHIGWYYIAGGCLFWAVIAIGAFVSTSYHRAFITKTTT